MESTATVDAAGPIVVSSEVADQAQAPDASPASQPDAAAADAEARKASGVTERINKLVGQRLERDRQIAELRRENESLKAGRPAAAPAPAAIDDAPKEADFNDYGQYLEARAEWKAVKAAEARFQKLQESSAATQRETQQREQAQDQQRQFASQVEVLSAEVPDFVQSLQSSLGSIDINGPLGQALLQSDKGAVLAYYLASNPVEQSRLEAIGNPVRAAIEIARLESKAEAHIQTRTRSKAARQAAPLGGGGGPGDDRPESAQSMTEYARRYYARKK